MVLTSAGHDDLFNLSAVSDFLEPDHGSIVVSNEPNPGLRCNFELLSRYHLSLTRVEVDIVERLTSLS
jgi:hypothetical protein